MKFLHPLLQIFSKYCTEGCVTFKQMWIFNMPIHLKIILPLQNAHIKSFTGAIWISNRVALYTVCNRAEPTFIEPHYTRVHLVKSVENFGLCVKRSSGYSSYTNVMHCTLAVMDVICYNASAKHQIMHKGKPTSLPLSNRGYNFYQLDEVSRSIGQLVTVSGSQLPAYIVGFMNVYLVYFDEPPWVTSYHLRTIFEFPELRMRDFLIPCCVNLNYQSFLYDFRCMMWYSQQPFILTPQHANTCPSYPAQIHGIHTNATVQPVKDSTAKQHVTQHSLKICKKETWSSVKKSRGWQLPRLVDSTHL